MILKNTLYYIFIFSIFLLLCKGAYAYFTWFVDFLPGILQLCLYVVFAGIAFLYKQVFNIHIIWGKKLILTYILFILASVFPQFNIGLLSLAIVKFYPLAVLLSDRYNYEKNLRIITILMALLLLSGLVFWGLSFGISAKGPIIVYPDLRDGYTFYNNIVSITSVIEDRRFAFNRFESVFLEPGFLGTLLSFLIYANRFDFKRWENFICLCGLMASFSLAGYLTTAVGYFCFYTSSGKIIRNLFISTSLFCVIYLIGTTYDNGDNIINETFFSRLQYDEEKGIVGNNRYNYDIDNAFNLAVYNGTIITGDPSQSELGNAGNGLKMYILTHGIVGALLFLLFYLKVVGFIHNKRYGYGFVCIVFITFMQASYPNSYSWLIPFFLGIGYQKHLEQSSVI
jgi:hypothetical protein